MRQKKEKKKEKKNRRNPWILLAPLLIFAAGAGIFLYPAISNYIAERQQKSIIRTYQAQVENQDEQATEAAWAEAEKYNENLAGDPVHDPFIMGSGYVLPDNYQEVLNLNGDGVMGYVEIPSIDVYLPIYHGTSEETLEKGAGHLDVTALPIGGLNRHSVISAHRGLPSAQLFTRLDEMEEGDVFYLHILDQILAYEVDQITVIEPEELSSLAPEADKDLVTLLTCTPYAVNTHRLLVRGTRVPYEEAYEKQKLREIETGHWLEEYRQAIILGGGILAGILILTIMIRKISKRKRGKQRGK